MPTTGHPPRPEPLHFALEPPGARDELVRRQLGGRSGRARHEIRDPIAPHEQLALFPRRENAIGEPGTMQHRPEPVPGPSEVVTGRAGIETGIDAAQQHAQPMRDHIRHRATRRPEHFGAGRTLRDYRAGVMVRLRYSTGP